ncbi:MAG: hypothetical protein ACHQKY_02755 [Terriglobia bacterium]
MPEPHSSRLSSNRGAQVGTPYDQRLIRTAISVNLRHGTGFAQMADAIKAANVLNGK